MAVVQHLERKILFEGRMERAGFVKGIAEVHPVSLIRSKINRDSLVKRSRMASGLVGSQEKWRWRKAVEWLW